MKVLVNNLAEYQDIGMRKKIKHMWKNHIVISPSPWILLKFSSKKKQWLEDRFFCFPFQISFEDNIFCLIIHISSKKNRIEDADYLLFSAHAQMPFEGYDGKTVDNLFKRKSGKRVERFCHIAPLFLNGFQA